MTAIISIEPANPRDIPPDELSGFVEELQAALPDYRVEGLSGQAMPRELRGVTWWQIVNVYLPETAGAWVVGKVLEAGYHWAKERFKRKLPLGKDRRPKYVRVIGPDGAEVGTMVLKSVRHKPVTLEEANKPQPVPRRRRKKSSAAKKKKKKRKRRKPGKGGKR